MVNQKRECILVNATELFYENGFQSVGVDLIISRSSVAKSTFYNHFPSKDNLIKSVLIRRNELIQDNIARVTSECHVPEDKLKAVFDWYAEGLKSEGFNGCMFIRASEELRQLNNNLLEIPQQHKDWLTHKIEAILNEMHISNSEAISKLIVVIFEGLTVKASMYETIQHNEIDFAWESIETMLRSYH